MLPTDSTLIVNEYNFLVEIQMLCYSRSAVVYEEDEQINVHFGPPALPNIVMVARPSYCS